MQLYKLRKLGQRGVGHYVVPVIAFVVLFGAFGAYFALVRGHAATTPPNVEWKGVSGTLQNVLTRTCLTAGSSTPKASFTPLSLANCGSGNGQKWVLTWGGVKGTKTLVKSGFSGYCMQTRNGNTGVNSTVGIVKCSSNVAQYWMTGYGNGQIETQSNLAGTNYCLGSSGSNIVTLQCNGGKSGGGGLGGGTPPTPTPTPTPSPAPSGSNVSTAVEWKGVSGTLQNVKTGTCLTIPGSAAPTASFTAASLASCGTSTGQKWTVSWGVTSVTKAAVKSGFSGFCLQTQNGNSGLNATAGISKCTGSAIQVWMTGYGHGQIETQSNLAGNNNCLGASGTKVVTLQCTGSSGGGSTTL